MNLGVSSTILTWAHPQQRILLETLNRVGRQVIWRRLDHIEFGELFLRLVAHKLVMFEAELVELRLIRVGIILGRAWGLANNEATAYRHTLVTLPA